MATLAGKKFTFTFLEEVATITLQEASSGSKRRGDRKKKKHWHGTRVPPASSTHKTYHAIALIYARPVEAPQCNE